MKRWVIVTDRAMELRDFKGQVQAAQLPDPDGYELDDWLEVVLVDGNPGLVWRLLCADLAVD